MDREDIVRMAREAGASQLENMPGFIDYLQKFAALVAAAEREACAKVCEELHGPMCDVGVECAAAIRARGG